MKQHLITDSEGWIAPAMETTFTKSRQRVIEYLTELDGPFKGVAWIDILCYIHDETYIFYRLKRRYRYTRSNNERGWTVERIL